MGNYFTEAKEIMRKVYGQYCNVVREAGIEPVPYHYFDSLTTLRHPEKKKSLWVSETRRYHDEQRANIKFSPRPLA